MTVSIALFAEKLLAQLPIASLIYAEDKRVVWASEAMEKWLHVEPTQLTGLHLGDLAIEKRKDEPGYFYINGVAMALSMHVLQLDQAGKIFACYFKNIAKSRHSESQQLNTDSTVSPSITRENTDSFAVHPYPIPTANCQFNQETATDDDSALIQDSLYQAKRPSIDQFLEYEISRSRRYNNPLSVVKLLFNIFPKHEHDWSAVSQSVFYFLSERTRWVDLIKNNKNGDFIIVFPETAPDMIPQIVNKIHAGLTRLFRSQYPHLTMHFDYGHACWQEGDTAETLLDRATYSLAEQRSQSK